MNVPHEFSIFGVYVAPMLIANFIGVVAAVATGFGLNRYRMSRYVANPPLVLLALMIIYSVLLGTFVVPS